MNDIRYTIPTTVTPPIQNAISNVVLTPNTTRVSMDTVNKPTVNGRLSIRERREKHIQLVILSRTTVLMVSLHFGHVMCFGLHRYSEIAQLPCS